MTEISLPLIDGTESRLSKEELARAIVRAYRIEDRDAVRTICYDTGLAGHPIDAYFGCKDLFADYWMNYYTDYEPESAFVAELNGMIVGYLVGCADTARQQRIQRQLILPQIFGRLITLGYKVDRRFLKFVWRYVRSVWKHEFIDEPVDDYPAHLHMNLAKGYRSGGIGSALLSTFLDHLRNRGIKGVHLGTTSYNRLAVPFYKKSGFRLVAQKPLTIYEGIISEKIDLLFFTRELEQEPGG
jgi:GNAT superfamily N-acetyltransferase